MPIKPGKDETESHWMGRCVPEMSGEGQRPQDQAVAACMQMWRDKDKEFDGEITRAWATLTVKRVSESERVISGIATTPTTDRLGDIVEPLGLKFAASVPLLWQHRHDQPVGWATFDKPTEKGISFSAKLARVDEPGELHDQLNKVWQYTSSGLVRGASIGFRATERSFIDGGGIRYIAGEILELSLVTVPANADATISTIRAIDAASLAAPGRTDARERPAVAGTQEKPERKAKAMPTYQEMITASCAKRDTAAKRMNELMSESTENGETLNETQQTEYDGLKSEVKALDAHIERLIETDELNKSAAKPAVGTGMAVASASREPTLQGEILPPLPKTSAAYYPRVQVKSAAPEWVPFIRAAMCAVLNRFDARACEQYARRQQHWHSSTPELLNIWSDEFCYVLRAAVPAGVTYDSTWAGALVYAQNLTSAFAEFLRPLTIIGRIPGLRRVPFNVRIPRATGGTSSGWVGESAPKPVTSMTFDTITLTWAKAAAISVLTEELVRFSTPAAETVVRDDLARGLVQFVDRQFVDPSVAAVTNVSPASITNGITPITATGVNMAAFRADVKSLFNSLLDDNQSLASGVWIMTQQQAMALSLAQNSLGQTIYPTINAEQGGTLLGYPVVASENIPATGGSPTDGYPLIFAVANEILLADDGQVTIDASREASLQMDSAPDSPPTASTNMLSLWQLNAIGLKAERFITWARRRSTAVAWIQNAKYAE